MLIEQPLPSLTAMLLLADTFWPSAEFQLCQAAGPNFWCFPTRFTPHVFEQHPARAGAPERLIYRAQAEGAGFAYSVDYRDVSELGAYNRVDDVGLVAALKVDATEIFAPIAKRCVIALALIAMFATLGMLLVRWRVRPLATNLKARAHQRAAELSRSEARFQALVETTSHIVWTADLEGNMAEDSPTWRAFTGQAYKQWKGSGRRRELVYPEARYLRRCS